MKHLFEPYSKWSLKSRMTVMYTLMIALIIGTLVTFAHYGLSSIINTSNHNLLLSEVSTISDILKDTPIKLDDLRDEADANPLPSVNARALYYIRIYDDNQKVILETPGFTQLLNKTNQMNLQTRRLSEAEFQAWSEKANRSVWVFHVHDRFGSQGLTGILSVEKNGARLNVVDFILSCRVMGRKVEYAMLAVAFQHALSYDCTGVDVQYLETKKNSPCLAFFQSTTLHYEEDTKTFRWESMDDIPVLKHIHLKRIE